MADEVTLPVTQADRDAAASLWFYLFAEDFPQATLVLIDRRIREGASDREAGVQAFTRHRLNALSAPSPSVVEGGE